MILALIIPPIILWLYRVHHLIGVYAQSCEKSGGYLETVPMYR
ncbi:MAG: hypothetical protein ACJASL_003900 [Paraglaciecola sp.]|jgi:hypothetical protein